jgi:hypothetical protein
LIDSRVYFFNEDKLKIFFLYVNGKVNQFLQGIRALAVDSGFYLDFEGFFKKAGMREEIMLESGRSGHYWLFPPENHA